MRNVEYYCDRCRQQVEGDQELVPIVFGLRQGVPVNKELCRACILQLTKWLETLPKETPQ